MHATFESRNDLDERLLAAQEGRLPGDEFMHYLMDSQVFLPVRETNGIGGFTAGDKAVPLTLQPDDGAETLVLFTSPERARSFLQDHPGFEGGLLAGFRWVLERTGAGVGISINPDWPVGMDLEPETIRQLRAN